MLRDDLLNRYSGHTFTETTVNDMTKVEFEDGDSNLIAMAQKMDVTDAYEAIRHSVDEDSDNNPCLTTTQRNALTGPTTPTTIWNITDDKLQVYDGSDWKDMN